jgi:hypothetical protein
VIETKNKSPYCGAVPITTAGRTLELVKSEKGIGSRTTSFLEQFIVNIVLLIIPSGHQALLRRQQPRPPLIVIRH